jgi:hypothetical protein
MKITIDEIEKSLFMDKMEEIWDIPIAFTI